MCLLRKHIFLEVFFSWNYGNKQNNYCLKYSLVAVGAKEVVTYSSLSTFMVAVVKKWNQPAKMNLVCLGKSLSFFYIAWECSWSTLLYLEHLKALDTSIWIKSFCAFGADNRMTLDEMILQGECSLTTQLHRLQFKTSETVIWI